jgi:VCBS repeat protein
MFSVSKMSSVAVAVVVLFSVGCGESAPAVADFNGDGREDLAVMSPDQAAVSVFLGQEDGTLSSEIIFPVEGGSAVAAQDADADGWVDLAVMNDAGGTVQVLRGHGPGGFTASDL